MSYQDASTLDLKYGGAFNATERITVVR